MNRIETLSPDLAIRLRLATTAQRRAAALAACEFSIAHARIGDPAVIAALRSLRAGEALEPEIRIRIESLAARLDEEYLQLQEAAEAGKASSTNFQKRFAEARAVAALAFLCKEEVADAAEEAIYEAVAAVADDRGQVLAVVQSQLS
jgi:hypothetical protein